MSAMFVSSTLPPGNYTVGQIKKLMKTQKVTLMPLEEMKRRLKLWDIVRDMIVHSMHVGEMIKKQIEKKKQSKQKKFNQNTQVEKKKKFKQKPASDNLSENVENLSTAEVVEINLFEGSENDRPRKGSLNAIEIVIEKRLNKILDYLLRLKDDENNKVWELVGGKCDPELVMKALKRRLKRQIKTLKSYS